MSKKKVSINELEEFNLGLINIRDNNFYLDEENTVWIGSRNGILSILGLIINISTYLILEYQLMMYYLSTKIRVKICGLIKYNIINDQYVYDHLCF